MNKSWRQHSTKQQLYGYLLPIMKTIKVRRTRHAGHSSRSRDALISDVLQWTPSHGRGKAELLARTYIEQLCEDTGCSSEDLLEAMNDWEGWRERVRDARVDSTTRWWWGFLSNTNNYIVSRNYFYWIIVICLHIVMWFQVTNNNPS